MSAKGTTRLRIHGTWVVYRKQGGRTYPVYVDESAKEARDHAAYLRRSVAHTGIAAKFYVIKFGPCLVTVKEGA